MKVRVGDYVRTKYGSIGKIYNINEFREPSKKYCLDFDNIDDFVFVGEDSFENIDLKSSPNIIDLIEVGDYVNGHIVEDLDDLGYITLDDDTIKYDDIKSIVTKEQFSQMEYRTGG